MCVRVLVHYEQAFRFTAKEGKPWAGPARGLHSFPFQLNLSSSVQRFTLLNSCMCHRIAQVELWRERV